MTVAAYKYFSDNGVTYQVILPSDFATALGYVAASGGEEYLPPFVSMRYASYISAQSLLQVSVAVCDAFHFGAPPPVVTVAGINYTLQAAYGEKRTGYPFAQLMTIAGPQGPQGAPGQDAVFTFGTATLGSDVALTSGTEADILTTGTLATGKYIVWAQIQFQIGTANPICDARITTAGNTELSSQSKQQPLLNNSWISSNLQYVQSSQATTPTFKLRAKVNAAGVNVRAVNNGGTVTCATQLSWLKVG